MSYNGSGTFVINTSGQPVVTNTVISSTAFNALTADLGTGLSTAITKDGQTTTTAKIPFDQGISAAVASNFAAGTVAAPAIYLSTDTGTGLYRIGANNDGFAISGTKLLDFGSALLGITGAATISTTLGVTGITTLGAAIVGPASATVFNTVSTTVNAFGAATTLNMGAATGTLTVANTTLAAKAITASTTLGVTGATTLAALSATTGTFSSNVAVTGTGKVSTGFAVGNATPGAGGVAFPATAVAVADANTLDDYEEGYWTPSLGGTATYSDRAGQYTKVGRIVTVWGSMTVNLIGTGSPNTMSGLPFSDIGGMTGVPSYFGGLATPVTRIVIFANGSNIRNSAAASSETTSTVDLNIYQNSARIDFALVYVTT